jgi:hypothetical protein
MLTLENCLIKKYWPKDDKGEEDEIIRQLVIQVDAALDNSTQVSELYNNMVRGLVRILFLDNLTGEEYVLAAATIKPFNIKQKKVKLSGDDETDYVKSEFAVLTIVTKIPEKNGGNMLAELYPFFGIPVQMTIEELELFSQAVKGTSFDDEEEAQTT